MGSVTPKCRWLSALALLRLCIQTREHVEEWSATAALQTEPAQALDCYRRLSVLQAVLYGSYPQFLYEIISSTGVTICAKDYESQRGLFRCAGEAAITMFRVDQSETMQRALPDAPEEAFAIREFAKCHIRESLLPIARQLQPSGRGRNSLSFGRPFRIGAEQVFLAWVGIRIKKAVHEVDSCISQLAASALALNAPWDAAEYQARLASADSIGMQLLPDACRALSALPAVAELLER